MFDTLHDILVNKNGVIRRCVQLAMVDTFGVDQLEQLSVASCNEVGLPVSSNSVVNFPISHDIDDNNAGGEIDCECELNVFKYNSDFENNERKYRAKRAEILGVESFDDDNDDDNKSEEENAARRMMVEIERLMESPMHYEEFARKLVEFHLSNDENARVCQLIFIGCLRSDGFDRRYGLLAQGLCELNAVYARQFENIFKFTFEMGLPAEIDRPDNVAPFFAHLLVRNAVSWQIIRCLRLRREEEEENDLTIMSEKQLLILYLLRSLAQLMGTAKLVEKMKNPAMRSVFKGLLPRDSAQDTCYAIKFYESIRMADLA